MDNKVEDPHSISEQADLQVPENVSEEKEAGEPSVEPSFRNRMALLFDVKQQLLRLEMDTLHNLLQNIDETMKTVFTSVMGPFRTGKSFMINALTMDSSELMNDNAIIGNQGIPFRGGLDRHTTGIWVLEQPILQQIDGETVQVVLIDTQGTFDTRSDKHLSVILSTVSLLIADYQIYNMMTKFDGQQFDNISLFATFAELYSSRRGRDHQAVLQFLLRDFNGPELGVLPDLFQKIKTAATESEEVSKNIQVIEHTFCKIECFGLPSPNNCLKTASSAIAVKDLGNDFRKGLLNFLHTVKQHQWKCASLMNRNDIKSRMEDIRDFFNTHMNEIRTQSSIKEQQENEKQYVIEHSLLIFRRFYEECQSEDFAQLAANDKRARVAVNDFIKSYNRPLPEEEIHKELDKYFKEEFSMTEKRLKATHSLKLIDTLLEKYTNEYNAKISKVRKQNDLTEFQETRTRVSEFAKELFAEEVEQMHIDKAICKLSEKLQKRYKEREGLLAHQRVNDELSELSHRSLELFKNLPQTMDSRDAESLAMKNFKDSAAEYRVGYSHVVKEWEDDCKRNIEKLRLHFKSASKKRSNTPDATGSTLLTAPMTKNIYEKKLVVPKVVPKLVASSSRSKNGPTTQTTSKATLREMRNSETTITSTYSKLLETCEQALYYSDDRCCNNAMLESFRTLLEMNLYAIISEEMDENSFKIFTENVTRLLANCVIAKLDKHLRLIKGPTKILPYDQRNSQCDQMLAFYDTTMKLLGIYQHVEITQRLKNGLQHMTTDVFYNFGIMNVADGQPTEWLLTNIKSRMGQMVAETIEYGVDAVKDANIVPVIWSPDSTSFNFF